MQKSAVIFLYALSASGRRLLTSMRNSRCRSVQQVARYDSKPRTERYLTLPNIHDFVQQVARYDPKSRTERYLTLLGIHDFVQLVARYNSLKNRQDCQFSQAP